MDWKMTPVVAVIGLALAAPVPRPAMAGNDAAKAAIAIGGAAAIICAMGGCGVPQPQAQPQRQRRGGGGGTPQPSAEQIAAQRQAMAEAREMQTALNGFGFNAGEVDGRPGPQTRTAIADYQSYMGYRVTGQLDDYQRGELVANYGRYQRGDYGPYADVVANEGPRGYLRCQTDPACGERYAATPRAPAPQQPVGVPEPAPVPPAGQQITTAPQAGGVIADDEAGLPPIDAVGEVKVTMADRCEFVETATRTNLGPIKASDMSNPDQALSEQFCEARSFLTSAGQTAAAGSRVSDAELATRCGKIEAFMAPVAATLGSSAPEAVTAAAKAVDQQKLKLTNPTTAAAYGQICLGLGYRGDDPEMALAASLVLVGAGYAPYGEMLGHHLREGFGTDRNPSAAVGWYEAALDALENGAAPAVLPSKTSERVAVIRAAIAGDLTQAGIPSGVPALVPTSTTVATPVISR